MILRAHWRHLANTIELVLPSAHRSPQSKWQINRFSRTCTAHGRKSLYLQWSTFPQKLPLSMEISGPHLIHNSLVPPESLTQAASRSVEPFSHRRPQSVPILYNGTPFSLKIAPSHGGSEYVVPWTHTSPQSKRHLDWFSRFAGSLV